MVTIQMPSITVQRVSNGYVVQWVRKTAGPERTRTVTAVCVTPEELLNLIDAAAGEIAGDEK